MGVPNFSEALNTFRTRAGREEEKEKREGKRERGRSTQTVQISQYREKTAVAVTQCGEAACAAGPSAGSH